MTDYCGLSALHPLAVCWRNMLSRCYNPNNNRFNTYGARGIIVEWKTFREFFTDMVPTWRPGLTIDREKNDKNYCKANCRWITNGENARRRTTSKLTHEQVTEIKKRFAPGLAYQEILGKEFGVSSRMIRYIGKGGAWA